MYIKVVGGGGTINHPKCVAGTQIPGSDFRHIEITSGAPAEMLLHVAINI